MANEREQRDVSSSPPGRNQEASSEERKAAGTDALNQLREILVGGAVRDLERRVARAEAHMLARTHEIEEEVRRRMEVLETHLRKESDALSARLERELLQMGEAVRAVTREQREMASAAEQRAGKLEESLVRAQREIRQELLEQAKRYLDELMRLRREVTDTLERELGAAESSFEQEFYGQEGRPAP